MTENTFGPPDTQTATASNVNRRHCDSWNSDLMYPGKYCGGLQLHDIVLPTYKVKIKLSLCMDNAIDNAHGRTKKIILSGYL